MLSEDRMSIVEELKNYSDNIRNSFNKLTEYEIDENNTKYIEELNKLKLNLYKENIFYEKLNKQDLYRMIIELDDNEFIDNLESNLDKFYNIPNLDKYYSELAFFRIINIIRDKAIIYNKITSFDDIELVDEEEIDDYYEKLLNTIIIEFQLFNDLLSLFIANLCDTTKLVEDKDVKHDLIIYKYLTAYTYGKNDLTLIEKNKSIKNTYIYSKLLYDMLKFSDKSILYNYDIIKTSYLDKVLYRFINNLEFNPNQAKQYINSSYLKALISLSGNDYERIKNMYYEEKKDNYNTKILDNIFNDSKKIISKTKILTLDK